MVCCDGKSQLRVDSISLSKIQMRAWIGLKEPPSDVVLVEELVSMTPRDFTQ